MNDTISKLAAYAVYRQLYDIKKNDVYFIISKFVENVIINDRLYSFGLTDITNRINERFGFDIPANIVKSSIGRLKYVARGHNTYSIKTCGNLHVLQSDISPNIIKSTEDCKNISERLINFAENKNGLLSLDERENLMCSFCDFLLDDSAISTWSDIITAFFLANENDSDFYNQIFQIRQGAVLYAGLTYKGDISNNSAWNQSIIIYLENEILFSLAGYNGDMFKKIAEETLSLIKEMNSKSKRQAIKIRCFEDVIKEIDLYFDKAIEIVEGKGFLAPDSGAMSKIVNGCRTASDVADKKVEFQRLLNKYSIVSISQPDVCLSENMPHVLENTNTIEKYDIQNNQIRYIKHLSSVNILRKGIHSDELKKCKHIILTETGKILKMSKDFQPSGKTVPLAIDMYMLTNRLWYDLNKGFGNSNFPTVLDVMVRSKIVLSGLITDSIVEKFEQDKVDFSNGILNEEQMMDRYNLYRKEYRNPEDFNVNTVEDALLFLSEERIQSSQADKELLSSKLRNAEKINEKLETLLQIQNEKTKQILIDSRKEKQENIELKKKEYERYMEIKKKVDNKVHWIIRIVKYSLVGISLLFYTFLLIVLAKANTTLLFSAFIVVLPSLVNALFAFVFERKVNILYLYKIFLKKIELVYSRKKYSEYCIDVEMITNYQEG